MTRLPPNIRQHLLEFICGAVQPQEFESWLYGASDLEAILSADEYLSIISADYKTRDGVAAAQAIAEAVLTAREPDSAVKYRVERLATETLAGGVDLVSGLRQLVCFYHQGCEFIPLSLVGLESETDSVPDKRHYHQWEPAALAKQLERLQFYRAQILCELENLVNVLQADRLAT